jgi:hypothetical protein
MIVAGAAVLAILGTRYPGASHYLDVLAGFLTGGAIVRSPGDTRPGKGPLSPPEPEEKS